LCDHALPGRSTFRIREEIGVKNCKLCGFSRFCNDLPGICIFLQMVAVVAVVGILTYLFVTQEVLG
jgi:hypothetical protein